MASSLEAAVQDLIENKWSWNEEAQVWYWAGYLQGSGLHDEAQKLKELFYERISR